MTVTAALLGCGLFSHDVYIRLIKEFQQQLEVTHVWSRSEDSAQQFVKRHELPAAVQHGDEGLQAIMQDAAIQLVIVVLPVQSALKVVQMALAAGKHVMEEKPVAGTVKEAVAAIQQYRMKATASPLWMFAENYRYETVFLDAAGVVAAGHLGRVIKIDLVADMPMNEANKYYSSTWRRDTSGCPGGQIMESSVHFIAALRLLAKAAGLGEATQACARTRHVKPDLSDPDTIVGWVTFPVTSPPRPQGVECTAAQEVTAGVSISLAASQVRWSLTVVGKKGSLEVLRGGWGGSRSSYTLNMQLAGQEPSSTQYGFSGTSREMAAFLDLITRCGDPQVPKLAATTHVSTLLVPLHGEPETQLIARSCPEEGARDLAVVEALLTSGRQQGSVVLVEQVPGPAMYDKVA